MTSVSEQFREKSRALQDYVLACENFIGAIDSMKAAVERMGSDPLGALSYLAAEIPDEEPNFSITETTIKKLDDPEPMVSLSVIPEVEPEAPKKAQVVGRANSTPPRGPMTENIRNAQKWLYTQLLRGPMPRNDIEELGVKAGFRFYSLNEARRHSDDIVQVTIGLRGPSWWYIVGDEHKLPNRKNGPAKDKPKLQPDDQKVLNQIGAGRAIAELIGRTGMKPTELRERLSRLQTRNLVTIDKSSGIWKPVTV